MVAIGYSQQFAAFIIGDKCDGINTILVRIDDKLNGDDKCIDVIASLTAVCDQLLSCSLYSPGIIMQHLNRIVG